MGGKNAQLVEFVLKKVKTGIMDMFIDASNKQLIYKFTVESKASLSVLLLRELEY